MIELNKEERECIMQEVIAKAFDREYQRILAKYLVTKEDHRYWQGAVAVLSALASLSKRKDL